MADKQVAHKDAGFQWLVESTSHNVSLVLNQPVDLGPRVKTHSVAVINKLREVPIFTKVKEIDSPNTTWPWEIVRMSVTFTIKRIPPPNPEKMRVAAAAIDLVLNCTETPKVVDALHHLADLAKTGPDGLHIIVVPLFKVITRPRVPLEVRKGAEDILRQVVDDFLPIDEFLFLIDGPEKPEAEAAKKVLEEQLECLGHLGSPEARLLHLYDNMTKDLPDSVPKTKQAAADAIQALEKDLTKEVETIEVISIPEHTWKPRSPRKPHLTRPTSPKIKPEDLALELASKAVEDAQDALAAADAALENLQLADLNTKDPEKKRKLKPKLVNAAKNRRDAAAALQHAQDVEEDLLEALEGEVIDPEVLNDKLDKARKAAKEAEEAGQAGKNGEAEAAAALEDGLADIAEEDLRPKALAAAAHAHHDSKKAGKHGKEAKKLCDKIEHLLPKLSEERFPQPKKDEIAKKAKREDDHAGNAVDAAKKTNKVAKQVPKDCEEPAKVKPAYLAAIAAQQKAKKAKDKGEHAHKKAKKLYKRLKDRIPISEIPPSELGDLAEDAKQLAEDAKERAKQVEAKAKKAKQIADHAPPHQKQQAEDVKEKAQKAEDAAKDAEKAAEAALEKIKELEAAVARLPEHPEEAAKVAELAKEARDLADKADKLSDLAEKFAQDLDFAMHSAVAPPEHANPDLPVEVDMPILFFLPPYAETPLEDIHLELAKIPNPFLPELFEALKNQDNKEKELDNAAKDLADKADKLEDAKKKDRDTKKHALEAKEAAVLHPTPANLEKVKKAAQDAAKADDDALKAKVDAAKAKEKAADHHADAAKARAHVPEVALKAQEFDAKEKDRVAPITPELKKNLDALKPQVADAEKKAEKDYQDALDKLKKAEAFEPEHPKPTPDDVLSADKDVHDLEKALEDAIKAAEAAKEQLKDAEEAAKKAHDKADKLAEIAKKHPTPENIAAATAAEDEADDYDESKLLAKIKAGEAQGTVDDILDALEKARAKACEERLKKKNDLYPDAEEPSAEDQKEYDAFKGETENKEGKADKVHGKAMDDLARAAGYEPLVPSKADIAKKIALEAAKIAEEADLLAQEAIDFAKDAEALSPADQKPEGLEPALEDALKAKGRAHHAQKEADDLDDQLDELCGEPIPPALEDKLVANAKKALDDAKKAHDAAKDALGKCKGLKPVEAMFVSANDLIPKIKEAVKKARDHAECGKKLEPRTKHHSDKAKEIATPILVPVASKPLKEAILHDAEEAKKGADHVGDEAKDIEKLAEEALEPVKVVEANPNAEISLFPALEIALKALHKAKKAHKKGKKAHKKGKKAHHKAKHLKPEQAELAGVCAGAHPGEHPEHPVHAGEHPGLHHPGVFEAHIDIGRPGHHPVEAHIDIGRPGHHPVEAHIAIGHPDHHHPGHHPVEAHIDIGHPSHPLHPAHVGPVDPKLIDEAKQLADDLRGKAKKNKPSVEKARGMRIPFSPQVNDDFHCLADEADKLGNDADRIADDIHHLVGEIQPIVLDAKAHPENAELQGKAHHLLFDLGKLADKADLLGDQAEDALDELLDGMDNLGPTFPPEDLVVNAPQIEVQAGRHRPDHVAVDEPFPCPFCQNAKWNWPEIFELGLGISQEDQQKLSPEEKCDKKMTAIQKAITKLQEVAKLVEDEKKKLGTP